MVRGHVPRQSARLKKSKQQVRAKHAGRDADVSVHFMRIQLPAPAYLVNKAPLEWFLLTTVDIGSAEDAECCLRWNCLRWNCLRRNGDGSTNCTGRSDNCRSGTSS